MSQEGQRPETRDEEVARVRSYLKSQAAKRTPAQIVDTVRESHQQFVQATLAVPENLLHTPPQPGEWSAAQVLAHMLNIADYDVQNIVGILENGKAEADWESAHSKHTPDAIDRETALADLSAMRERLTQAALAADPNAYPDLAAWNHPEFGELNWREALLFARVHTLDHARQIAAIASHFAVQAANNKQEVG